MGWRSVTFFASKENEIFNNKKKPVLAEIRIHELSKPTAKVWSSIFEFGFLWERFVWLWILARVLVLNPEEEREQGDCLFYYTAVLILIFSNSFLLLKGKMLHVFLKKILSVFTGSALKTIPLGFILLIKRIKI